MVAFTKADGSSVPVREISTIKRMEAVPPLFAVIKWDHGRRFFYVLHDLVVS